ncbi:MAG: peptide chain release factor 2 [Lentisphaeria bacterium]|nr:peptide chain release factor 2 [Lentisphaeria bacterium]
MTLEELQNCSRDFRGRLEHLRGFLKIEERRAERQAAEERMAAPDFWDNKDAAQETVSTLSSCRAIIEPFEKMGRQLDDFEAGIELAAEDEEFMAESEKQALQIGQGLDQMELLSFLSGPFDRNNFYFSVHAGAGGTEACDWGSMLLRMYRRYFERRGWKDEMIDMQPGEEAGVKSATFRVFGEFAYGYMKGECGVHRLVRISPFDSNARRHTSFCSVDIFPEIDDAVEVEIDENDLRIDTYRASGAGGQHVNRTDSAVRITHLPTGIVVCCQNERSQHKNRDTAMSILRARLYEYRRRQQEERDAAIRGEKVENGWGSQIRSYVLQPYQMVKDLRTDVETSDTTGVLDGDIEEFVEAYVRCGGKPSAQ